MSPSNPHTHHHRVELWQHERSHDLLIYDIIILITEVTISLTCHQPQVISWCVDLTSITSSICSYDGIDMTLTCPRQQIFRFRDAIYAIHFHLS